MSNALILTKDNFENEVLNSDKTVLIDFYAVWCGPCKMLSPVIDKIAAENPDIKVCKVNVDEAMEVAEQYFISSIPAVKFFKGGEVVNESIGFVPQQKLEGIIEGII